MLDAGSPAAAHPLADRDRGWLDRLDEACPRLSRPIAFIGVLGMLIVSSATMIDVLLRWFGGSGVVALNEIVEMIFAVTVAACLPYGIATRINMRVDVLGNWIRGRLSAWADVFAMALSLTFFCILTWRLFVHAQSMAAGHKITLILGWPVAPFLFGVTAMLAVTSLIQFIITASAWKQALFYRPDGQTRESSSLAWLFVLAVYAVAAGAFVFAAVDYAAFSKLALTHSTMFLSLAALFLWLLLMALAPLSAAMSLVGLFCTSLFIGTAPSLSAFGSEVEGFLMNNQVAVLPLFMMMGSFATVSGVAEDLYALAHAVFARLPAGLAISTIGGCAGFGAITGSTIATTAMVGRIALPEMQSRGYSPALATGSIAAGGTLGNLVPPGSGPLVIFALLTEASIGQLFIASALPAVLAIAAYICTAWLYAALVPGSAPRSGQLEPGALGRAVRRSGPAALLFGSVLGGLYAGIFTDTEAAAVGAFGAFLVALFRGKLKRASFFQVMGETTETTALVYPLIFGALIFAFFTSVTGVTELVTGAIGGLDWPPLAVISLLLVVFLVLGTFMDSYTIMIVTVPVVTGLILKMGYDIVWWGVLNLFVVEIGGLSPPFGITLYLLKDMAKVSIGTVFRGVTPFCIAGIIVLGILTYWPSITLWLPSTMR